MHVLRSKLNCEKYMETENRVHILQIYWTLVSHEVLLVLRKKLDPA